MENHLKRKGLRFLFVLGLQTLVCMLAGTGCAPPRELHTTYILPPKQAVHLAPGTTFQLAEPGLSIKSDGAGDEEPAVFRGYLRDRFTALIYQENAYRVADEFCGSSNALAQLQNKIANHHGYSNIHCPPSDPVVVKLEGTVTMQKQKGIERVERELRTTPYKIVKKTNKDGTQEVSSEPELEKENRRVKVDNIPFEALMATGELRCTIRSEEGKILYRRGFHGLKFSAKVGGNGPEGALPTPVEIAARLFNAPLVEIVKDISPHSESRSLVVNEKGDPTAVALMRATAFSEAMERLDKVIAEHEKKYGELKKEREEELDKKIEEINVSSKPLDAKASEIEKAKNATNEELRNAMSPLSPDFHNAAIGCEVTGDWDLALYYYKMACEADPHNAQARESLDRLNAEINKIKKQEKDSQRQS
jgi:hypothetical protein